MKINEYIDHTLLKSTATESDIVHLCKEAITHNFVAVCVNGTYTSLAKSSLQTSKVKIATVVGFPLGTMQTSSKIFEMQQAILDGADEIDMVINLGWVKSGQYDRISEEIGLMREVIEGRILKVIIETCYLTDDEKRKVISLVLDSGAEYIKTSTGFGPGGATPEDVILMKEIVGDQMKIKASGGIRDYETALKYIELGASRIGTSSGVKIMEKG